MNARQPDQVKKLVEDTKVERAKVRTLISAGRWQEAERNPERSRDFAAKRIRRARGGAGAIQGDTLEYQPASFFSEGASTRRAVAYVEVSFGTRSTIGSGFMVSPRLFLTNQHVTLNAQAAVGETITIDRKPDAFGQQRATTVFRLATLALALFSDESDLDYPWSPWVPGSAATAICPISASARPPTRRTNTCWT